MAASGAHADRHGLVGLSRGELPKLGPLFCEGWYIVFVVFLLVVLLLVTTRESLVPWLATALLLVLNQLFSPQRRGRRELLAFLAGNGRVCVELVAILAGVGLLVGAFSLTGLTGLTGTLTTESLFIAGDSALLLMLMLMLMLMGALTSFVLGMGMTITVSCIFLAVLLAPSLFEMGLDPLAVHMFIMY